MRRKKCIQYAIFSLQICLNMHKLYHKSRFLSQIQPKIPIHTFNTQFTYKDPAEVSSLRPLKAPNFKPPIGNDRHSNSNSPKNYTPYKLKGHKKKGKLQIISLKFGVA